MSRLEGLPAETLLNIGRLFDSSFLEVSRNPVNGGFFEVESPDWQGLRSFKLASKTLGGAGFDAWNRAVRDCDRVAINLFRPDTPCVYPTSPLGDFTTRVPNSLFGSVRHIHLTLPLHFIFQLPESRDYEVLITCNMKFDKRPGRSWSWSSSDFEYLIPPRGEEEFSLLARYNEVHKRIWTECLRELNDPSTLNGPPSVLHELRLGNMLSAARYAVTQYQGDYQTTRHIWRTGNPWANGRVLYESLTRN